MYQCFMEVLTGPSGQLCGCRLMDCPFPVPTLLVTSSQSRLHLRHGYQACASPSKHICLLMHHCSSDAHVGPTRPALSGRHHHCTSMYDRLSLGTVHARQYVMYGVVHHYSYISLTHVQYLHSCQPVILQHQIQYQGTCFFHGLQHVAASPRKET
jgi:hypothetical protein